jgi:hypothetical protein
LGARAHTRDGIPIDCSDAIFICASRAEMQ